ncbi:MAG: signal peptidase II [Chloroflexota bacterium]
MQNNIQTSHRLGAILIITFIVVSIDQATKYWAWLTLRGAPTTTYLDGIIRLSFHENPGAFLSLGATLPPFWRTLIFTVLVAFFLIYLFYYLLTEQSISEIGVRFGAMMFAGGLGNLIDRIFFENGVIDFLNVGYGNLRTGVFNVADMAIMVGVFGMLFLGRAPMPDPAPQIEDKMEKPQEENYEYEQTEN